MSFSDLRTWFHGLSPNEQSAVDGELTKISASLSRRILPLEHGDTKEAQWRAGKTAFLSKSEPFSMVRIGDFEVALLGAMYWPFGNPTQSYETIFVRAGYRPEAFPMRTPFIEAVLTSELVGVWGNDLPTIPYMNLPAILALLGIQLPMSTAVEINLPYHMLLDGTLFTWLSGKRVLLIGHLAPRLEQLWKCTAFHDAYACFGPSHKVRISGAVPMRSREQGGAWLDFGLALRLIERPDYDVALLACGATAKALVPAIRKTCRTVLDVGFVFDALTWERPDARIRRPVFETVEWPKEVFA